MAPRRRQPSVLVRLRYVGLEGGLYALALCPFGHITNAGLAANYVRLCATVFSFTINAHKQASCELVRICILTIVALASLIKRIEPARCLVLTSKNSMCNCNLVYVIYVCGYSNDDFFGSFWFFFFFFSDRKWVQSYRPKTHWPCLLASQTRYKHKLLNNCSDSGVARRICAAVRSSVWRGIAEASLFLVRSPNK